MPDVPKVEPCTICQTMASFLSHDIRHHLSGIYCNAEFMSAPNICPTDRQQLLEEVREAIQNMTGLLDFVLFAAGSLVLGHGSG